MTGSAKLWQVVDKNCRKWENTAKGNKLLARREVAHEYRTLKSYIGIRALGNQELDDMTYEENKYFRVIMPFSVPPR